MFARIVEFIPKLEKKEELVKVIRTEVLPILKKQTGFLEVLPFVPETKTEKIITVTLWMEERNAKRYEREVYPRVGLNHRPEGPGWSARLLRLLFPPRRAGL